MRITIEDLDALKELNDELEENHVEAERQLNQQAGELLGLPDSRLLNSSYTRYDHWAASRRISTL